MFALASSVLEWSFQQTEKTIEVDQIQQWGLACKKSEENSDGGDEKGVVCTASLWRKQEIYFLEKTHTDSDSQ